MTETTHSHYTLTDNMMLVAASILSSIGALVFNAFPLFLSATANQFLLDDAQLGFLGTGVSGVIQFSIDALFAEHCSSILDK